MKPHRASAQRRRAALLEAAAELAAEVGAGAVTHRAVAARAGVPLSTTSYFFASIDDLVAEALRTNVNDFVDTFDAAEKAWVLNDDQAPEQVLGEITDALLEGSDNRKASQVELFLAAGRDPELRSEVSEAIARIAERSAWQVERYGGAQPMDVAWAILALVDGAMLHRVAGIDIDHRDRLHRGLRLVLAAAALEDHEIDGLLTRFGSKAASNGGAGQVPDDVSADPAADPAATV